MHGMTLTYELSHSVLNVLDLLWAELLLKKTDYDAQKKIEKRPK
jgi:hypothetical protein